MTWRTVEGVSGFRRKDGQVQKYERTQISLSWATDRDPKSVGEELIQWAETHDDAVVEIEHTDYASGDYSCETVLELRGWINSTEEEIRKERKRLRDQHTRSERERIRHLEEELARLKK